LMTAGVTAPLRDSRRLCAGSGVATPDPAPHHAGMTQLYKTINRQLRGASATRQSRTDIAYFGDSYLFKEGFSNHLFLNRK
ncbi:MAG: hypothetical protein MI755_17470, partial [Sphingomonadales bacterium]|nr:hypothetical protein [Sphingomonadales bacterium]